MGNAPKVKSSNNIPSWLSAASQDIVGQAGDLYRNSQYTPYTGQRVAGLSGNEQKAIGMAGDPNAYKQFMNPFVDDVLDYSAGHMRDQYGQDLNKLRSQSVSRGAFGGSRQTQLEGQLREGFGKNLGEVYAGGKAQAFDRAQGSANNAFGQLLETGGLERGLNQAQQDVNYQQFREGQDYPWMNLDRYRSVVSGVPYSMSQTQSQSGGQGNQLLGLGTAALGAFMMSSKKVKDKRGPTKNVAGALAQIPVDRWNYKGDKTEHIGPYAEDFNRAIGKPEAPVIAIQDGIGAAIAGVGELERRVGALEGMKKGPKKAKPKAKGVLEGEYRRVA